MVATHRKLREAPRAGPDPRDRGGHPPRRRPQGARGDDDAGDRRRGGPREGDPLPLLRQSRGARRPRGRVGVRRAPARGRRSARPGRRLPERLAAAILTHVEFFERRRDFFRLFLSVAHPGPCRRALRTPRAQLHTRSTAPTSTFSPRSSPRARPSGEIRPFPPDRLALFVAEGLAGVILRTARGDRPAPRRGGRPTRRRRPHRRDQRQEEPMRTPLGALAAALLLFPATPPARAEGLTLADAFERALSSNLSLERARRELPAADAQRKAMFAALLRASRPSETSALNSTEVSFGEPPDDRTILPKQDWDFRVVATQPLFAGLREKRAYDQSKLAVEGARETGRRRRGGRPPRRRIGVRRGRGERGARRGRDPQRRPRRAAEQAKPLAI